jgi:biotin transport system substrate-specific component
MLMHYTLQLPMALFIAALLGPFAGTMAVALYILIGLAVAPVFANGGGWPYVLQPGFGYWLGILTASVLLGRSFYRAFQKEDGGSCSLKLLRQIFGSVLTVHGVGVAYLIVLVLLRQVPPADLPGWALRLTLEPLPYDLLAASVLLCLVRQARLALWMVLY